MELNHLKAAIVTLGCKVNQYESDAMMELLKAQGVEMTDPGEWTDLYIVNTCSVTNMAERKSRQMLHRARKLNENVVVAAVGCYAQADQEALIKDPDIDILIGNNKKKDIVSILKKYNKNQDKKPEVEDISKEQEYEELFISTQESHTRAYIKIQDGCNQFCSYCIIPYVRGRVRSRHPEQIIDEIAGLVRHDYQEFVLTGIHISSYGCDLDHGNLIELIERISQIPGVRRIRLGSLEPGIIIEPFLKRLKEVPQFCPHFHISIQSGSDTVLKRMNRKYSSSDIKEKCRMIRTYFDLPAITTDIIVGFPGETEEEFFETEAFLKEINLYEIHVFKYSKRKGTIAAQMEEQVDGRVKTERSNKLISLTKEQKMKFEQRQQGMEKEVLFEEKAQRGNDRLFAGHTREYVKTVTESATDLTNKILKVRMDSSNGKYVNSVLL